VKMLEKFASEYRRTTVCLALALLSCTWSRCAQQQPSMTDEQKIASWKGERVILLVGEPTCYMTTARRACSIYPVGNPRQRLPNKEYHGKTGVVTGFQRPSQFTEELAIVLDGSGEKVATTSLECVGFFSERQILENLHLQGRSFWCSGSAGNGEGVLPLR
jgi:hypothetical protein